MSHKQVKTGDPARQSIKAGIDLVANVVKTTLGPRGRNIVLDTNPYGNPLNTNDGVTIARELHSQDPYEEVGVKIVKAVASKTNDVAGDGTTTASLLLQAMTTHGLQQINNGADPVLLRRGIEKAADAVIAALQDEIVETKDLKALINVATISCGDEAIGKIVAEAVHKVGTGGIVTIEDSEVEETTARIAEGIELRGGIQLPVFINNPVRQEADLSDVPIFVTDHDFTNGLEVVKIMEACAQAGHKSAALIANSVQGEAMAACVVNMAQGKFSLIPIKIMALGEQGQGVLRDMAAATGGKFYSRDEGNKLPQTMNDSFNIDDFGHAERVIASKDRTTILGGEGDADARIEELEAQEKNLTKAYEKNMIKERIAKLRSGVGVIRVGGVTEAEREERKLRVEDAINASKAAMSDGIIAGGGAALYRAATKVQKDTKVDLSTEDGNGLMAVIKACFEPIKQMAINSGLDLDKADLERVLSDKQLTIDFYTGAVVNAFDNGIIDPSLVTVSAVKNAASEAALFVITEGTISISEDDSEKV